MQHRSFLNTYCMNRLYNATTCTYTHMPFIQCWIRLYEIRYSLRPYTFVPMIHTAQYADLLTQFLVLASFIMSRLCIIMHFMFQISSAIVEAYYRYLSATSSCNDFYLQNKKAKVNHKQIDFI